jgi:hypothetical protein
MHWIDHNFLPDICGTVDRFIVNRHGEVDGLVLMYEPDRFLFVHLPSGAGHNVGGCVGRRHPGARRPSPRRRHGRGCRRDRERWRLDPGQRP